MKGTAQFKFKYILLGCAFLISTVHASFDPLPVGARAAGMGEAYTAIVDDVYSLYYNPAGVLQLSRPQFGSYYSQLFVGLSDNSEISRTYLGYGQPFGKEGKWGAIGASYLSLNLPSLYKEETIGLTYGRSYKRDWNVGATLKLLKKSIGSDDFTNNAIDPISGSATGAADPVLASGRDESAFGLDFGLQYRLNRFYAMGFAFQNINSPDLSLSNENDKAPAVINASLARRIRKGALGLELSNWKSAETNTRISLGAERWFKNGFGLRAGGQFGSRNLSNISFGASYQMNSLQFDYATVFPLQGIKDTIGTQQVSLTLRLGRPPVDPLEQQLIKEKEQRIRAETEARYAKAERDRLKKQLLILTEAKSENEKEKESMRAEQALQEAQDQAEKDRQADQDQKRRKERRAAFDAYTQSLAEYNERVRRGIGLQEKRRVLERIQSEFRNKNIDLSTVERELKSIKVEQAQARKDFELSMNFYRRLVEQGASKQERRSMLQRIIQKYKSAGINISSAQNEINGLK